MQIIRFFLEYPWRCQNVISFFIFFLVFLYIHIFSFLSSFNSLQLIHTSTAGLCMVQFYLLPSPPGNPRDKSSPSGPGVGGGGCPGGRGLGQIKCEVRACHFSRGLHDSYTMAIFKEKRRNFLESGWRGITYQK